MYLGLTLHKLDDFRNAMLAFKKSLEVQRYNLVFLNTIPFKFTKKFSSSKYSSKKNFLCLFTSDDFLILINYCIILAKHGAFDDMKTYFIQFEDAYRRADSEAKAQEPEVA